ncbi:SUMF1/EgtB/PvdO family nonheme iron enzyme [Geothrix sp. SG200]|uniref:SUMF1/EgtB/PvdO family nonheme iron enzyme n=1 Tax=Geothrix sp. SG200 TaxID=2922865 RepID=UPI001FACEF13
MGLFLAQAVLALAMACGGGGGTPPPNTAPLITTQPASQTVNAGSAATFTAAASGTPAPTFTWQRSNDGGTSWTAIPGATSATYTTAATVKADNAAQFRAVATNNVSPDATSTAATLTVRWLAITTQPANASVTAGATATFTVVPDASPVATYQWQSSTNGTTWANVSSGTGATSASYTTAATSLSDTGTQYRCALTNAAGTLNSSGATLTVIAAPVITSFVAAKSPVTTGTGTTLTAVFTGGTGTVDHGIGTVTSGVAVPTGNVATTTVFTLTVTNATGTAVTLPVTVTAVAAPTTPVVTAPANVTANQAGYTASVPAQAGSTYAWTLTNGSITAGASTTSITFTAGASGTATPSCIVTNAAGTASTAGTATCTIVAAPTTPVITAPANVTASQTGYTASVPAQAGSTYAWTLTNGSITAGASTTSITFTAGASGNTIPSCIVTNAAGTASTAGTATCAIVAAPTTPVITAPANVTASQAGYTASVPAQAGSTYAWTITNGSITAGASTTSITFTAGASGTATPSCIVTNAAGTASTAGTAACTIVAAPTTPVVTAPANVTASQAGYTASVPAQPGSTYAWTITNGSITAGASTTSITFTAGASGSTILSCIVTNAAGTASMAGTATCTIVAAPAITSFTASGGLSTITITNGLSTTLSFTFSGGTGSIDQGVGSVTSLGTKNVSPTVTTTYTLTVDNGVSTPATAQVTVNVVDPPVITSFTAADSLIAPGTSTTLTGAFTGGSGSVDHGVGAVTTAVAETTGNLTTTTTFTLTVTNTATTPATATATATVTVGNTLTVNITGLGSLPGNVVVTGPNGYTSAVLTAATQTLSGLADGDYTITPAVVTDPSQPGQGRGVDGTGTPGTLGPANLQRYPAVLSLTQTLALAGTNTATVGVDYPAPYLTVTVPADPMVPILSTSIDLVLVPAGTFTMGETESVVGSDPSTQPSHGVTLGKAFYISKAPCTQAQWVAIMNNNPAHFTTGNGFPDPEELTRPVETVDFDAITTPSTGFLDMLNSAAASVLTGPLAGSSFRLPTEAEYEYACRAGSGSTVLNVPDPLNNNYYFGSYDPGGGDPAVILLVQQYMWHSGNSNLTTQPVTKKLPNAWGLYDMIGNVWELCRDDWHADYSVTGAGIPPLPVDGSAWLDATPNIQHSYKGGSWAGTASDGQSKRRGAYPINPVPTPANEYAGFRLVLPLP